MACRSCDLKRIYRLFEEKKRRETEEGKALSEAAERDTEEAEEKARREEEVKVIKAEVPEKIKKVVQEDATIE